MLLNRLWGEFPVGGFAFLGKKQKRKSAKE